MKSAIIAIETYSIPSEINVVFTVLKLPLSDFLARYFEMPWFMANSFPVLIPIAPMQSIVYKTVLNAKSLYIKSRSLSNNWTNSLVQLYNTISLYNCQSKNTKFLFNFKCFYYKIVLNRPNNILVVKFAYIMYNKSNDTEKVIAVTIEKLREFMHLPQFTSFRRD